MNKKYREESKIDKLFEIKYCLKVIEGINLYDFMKAFEMCLVLDVVIPWEFKVLEFVKYTRVKCPKIHLKIYCNKMKKVIKGWQASYPFLLKKSKW